MGRRHVRLNAYYYILMPHSSVTKAIAFVSIVAFASAAPVANDASEVVPEQTATQTSGKYFYPPMMGNSIFGYWYQSNVNVPSTAAKNWLWHTVFPYCASTSYTLNRVSYLKDKGDGTYDITFSCITKPNRRWRHTTR